MKLKHTQARKANRGPSITSSYPYGVPVFWRRVQGILGADHKEFSAKHPRLDLAVEGMRARLEAERAAEKPCGPSRQERREAKRMKTAKA